MIRFKENRNKQKFLDSKTLKLIVFMLSPAMVIVLLIIALPMVYSFFLSFTNFSLLSTKNLDFVGLENYFQLFMDDIFIKSLIRTIVFLALSISIEFVLGFSIALLLSRFLNKMEIVKSLLMTPMMLAPIVVGFLFKWLFNDRLGLINNLIYAVTGVDYGIAWLIGPISGLFSILVAEIWMSTPFMILVFSAGLSSLSKEPFEAAIMDGATGWQKLKYVTLPLMSPYIYIAMVIRSLDIAKSYDMVRIMTDGGPANRTELVWTYVYRVGISSNNFALGIAMSFITVAISFTFTLLLFKQLNYTRKA